MQWNRNGSDYGPWGQKPNQVEQAIERMRKRFKVNLPLSWIIIAIFGFIWALTCVYKVQPDEVGVIQRFGKHVRTSSPGLNFKLPLGIEKVTKVAVQKVYTEEFGMRTIEPGVRTQYAPSQAYIKESMMLTGDLNVAIVPWIIQYRVKDEYKYLFKVKEVRETLRDLSEAVMRQVVGDRSINEVINKRKEISDEAKVFLQAALDGADTGIVIINVELKTTTVPEPVQPSFNEVNQAIQEKEKLIYQAKEQYNQAIPAARGEAERMILQAEGYAMNRINRAKGDAARFMALHQEYSKAKEVTRRRLYLETMSEVLPKLGPIYIVDHEQKGLLPILDLTKEKAEK